MSKTRYKVIAYFQTLDDDGDWTADYSDGDILYRIVGTRDFEDEHGNLINFKQEDIKDYLEKIG